MPASSDPTPDKLDSIRIALDEALRVDAWEDAQRELVATAPAAMKPLLRSLSYQSVVVKGDGCLCVVLATDNMLTLARPQFVSSVSTKIEEALGRALRLVRDGHVLAVRIVLANANVDESPEVKSPTSTSGAGRGPVDEASGHEEFVRMHGRPPLTDAQMAAVAAGAPLDAVLAAANAAEDLDDDAPLPPLDSAAIGATVAAIEAEVAAAAVAAADKKRLKEESRRAEAVERFPRDDDALDFYNYPVNLMFPWKVLKDPKDAVGNSLPRQNLWIGRNGSIIHVIYGGLNEDGLPLGIPGHSLPLALGIYLITEYKLKLDKGSGGKVICLGDNLAELWRALGYLGPVRGKRAERAIERICQYFECTHQIIEFPMTKSGEQMACDLYNDIVKSGKVPDGPHGDKDERLAVAKSYNVWSAAKLSRHGGPLGFVTLTDEFIEKFAGDHAVPIPWEIVARLIKYPQALSLTTILLQTIDRLWRDRHKRKPECSLRVDNLQDMAGLNHDKGTIDATHPTRRKWKRPGPTLRMMREHCLPAIAWAVEQRGVAGWDNICDMPEKGLSGTETKIKLRGAPSLTSRRGGKRVKSGGESGEG